MPTICKYLNSPMHFVKISSKDNYGHNYAIDENARNFMGRKIEVNSILSKDKALYEQQPNINNILVPNDSDKKQVNYDDIYHIKNSDFDSDDMIDNEIDTLDDSEIFRPGITFVSNARPAVMAWREVEMEETLIMKPPKQQKPRNRLKKKYSRRVPVHLGYSRNLIDYPLPSPQIFQKRNYRYPESTLVWLQPTNFNGLPQKLVYMRPLLKMRKLNVIDDNSINL